MEDHFIGVSEELNKVFALHQKWYLLLLRHMSSKCAFLHFRKWPGCKNVHKSKQRERCHGKDMLPEKDF